MNTLLLLILPAVMMLNAWSLALYLPNPPARMLLFIVLCTGVFAHRFGRKWLQTHSRADDARFYHRVLFVLLFWYPLSHVCTYWSAYAYASPYGLFNQSLASVVPFVMLFFSLYPD